MAHGGIYQYGKFLALLFLVLLVCNVLLFMVCMPGQLLLLVRNLLAEIEGDDTEMVVCDKNVDQHKENTFW